ncbi:MAG: histidine ammonia-lyase [Candidatus Eremiobacteraeota bacterium]|nr:histidine ammonia-lyase [Candidatus Eremiobacteraeota bacterium]
MTHARGGLHASGCPRLRHEIRIVLTSHLVHIDGTNLTIPLVKSIATGGTDVKLADNVRPLVQAGRDLVERTVKAGEQIYGVTTGFGRLKSVMIDPKDAIELQRNLVLSHCTGVGEPLPEDATRASVLLRAHSLARGYSGVRAEIIDLLLEMLNRRVWPLIPSKGSVGASGDLAPLAHMALVLIGEGEAMYAGERLPGGDALRAANLKPVVLSFKEGLALINGTQIMTGIGALTAYRAELACKAADIAGAMSLEAFFGTAAAFDERLNALRPHPGQARVAANMRHLLRGSGILASHVDCDRVQDPYSFRCIPVVHGAVRDALHAVENTLVIEMNSVTDNPIVIPEDASFLTGGNFHGEPVALAMDYLSMALTELGSIAERRIYKLLEGLEGLPPFLSEGHGLHSGYMLAQYTAAALVSENKTLSYPASVDSIPTSAGQEDHVSMGTISARQCEQVVGNLENVIAIELLEAAQALDFRAPLTCGKGTAVAHRLVRERVPHLKEDRNLSQDIAVTRELVRSGELVHAVEAEIGVL